MNESREYPSHPLAGVGAVLHKGHKVLLIKRKYPPNEGHWALPGGLVELGESVQDAVVREVKEETGISVRLEGLLDISTDIHLDATSKLRYHYVLIDYVARPVGSRVRLNDESSAYGWFSSDEVKKLDMSRGTREALALYFARRPTYAKGSARRPTGKRSP